ncbi:3-oxoacyl [Neohortaea acidophila]|uniref:3-oxoacyl n=1 Tax=Neohortaea acidophila TaxID=245834 RepID=A0A6A6PYV0_9PEZI|nr:3-oxoacyl [Neohortaea acidophila]KAF2484914.1 3-oxoacyl [Neohortaea acidophila]
MTTSRLNFPQGLLAGQVAIITGAAQGIGAETARVFSREGCKVAVADLDQAKASAVVEAIKAEGGDAIAVAGDVTKNDYIDLLVQKTAEFGNGQIHIIVNNAGYAWDDPIEKIQDKQWDTIISLHNTAPFKLVRAAAPYFMVEDGKDRCIINISSTSGVYGNAGQASYALAKAGVIGLTKTIALEWGPRFGVRANTVAFGPIKTRLTTAPEGEFVVRPDGTKHAVGFHHGYDEPEKWIGDIPLRRIGTPQDAAKAILATASPLFSYVTGQTIMVSGGRGGM